MIIEMTEKPEQLAELRERWESGARVVGVYTSEKQRHILVVIEYKEEDQPDDGKDFTLMRYFPLGDEWVASCDEQNATLEEVMHRMMYVADYGIMEEETI